MQRTARRLIGVMAAMVLTASAGQAWGAAAEVRVIGAAGPVAAGELMGVLPVGTTINSIDHMSASPGGRLVVVAQMSSPTWGSRQVTLVRDLGGQWRVAAIAGITTVKQLTQSALQMQLGSPIVNDAGEVLTVATVSGASPAGTIMSAPSLVRINADGTIDLLLRFNTTSGPGVPALPPHMSSVLFSNVSTDHWRFTNDGALFAGANAGLLGPCAGDVEMGFRTFVQPRSTSTQLPPFGTAVPVAMGNGSSAMSSGGFVAQALSSNGYTREGLRGIMTWDKWGLPHFAVRDGTTPIEGLTDQFVLETNSGQTGDATSLSTTSAPGRVSMNSACRVAFVAKFGVLPPSPTGVVTQLPPVNGPLGLFIKDPGYNAQLLVRLAWTSTLATDAPGVPGARFAALTAPILNEAGQLVFHAGLSNGKTAIYTADRDGALRLVAASNVMAGTAGGPDGPAGASFAGFYGEPTINARGQIVFKAMLNGSAQSGGVAVMAWDPTTGMSTLVRTGQVLSGPEIGTRTLTVVSSLPEIGGVAARGSGNNDGQATTLTNDGEVVMRLNSSGVSGAGLLAISARIPTAVGACCTGSTCTVMDQLDCGGAATSFAGRATVCAEPGRIGDSCCPADFDQNGQASLQDLFDYLAAWGAKDSKANADGLEGVELGDLMLFLQAYLGGC